MYGGTIVNFVKILPKPVLYGSTKIKYNKNAYNHPSFQKIMQKMCQPMLENWKKCERHDNATNVVFGFFLKLEI